MKEKRKLRALLARTRDAAERNYLKRSEIVGVSVGPKFRKGLPSKQDAIQFFVTRKLKRPPKERCLPGFVYGRAKDVQRVESKTIR